MTRPALRVAHALDAVARTVGKAFGWLNPARARASRAKRSRAASSVTGPRSRLIATRRRSTRSWPRYTSPMPPDATSSSTT